MSDSECALLLVYDIKESSKASTQELIDDAYDNGFGLISYPLIDSKVDKPQLIQNKYIRSNTDNDDEAKDINDHFNNNVLSNIPFNYFEDSSAEIFHSVYGKISPWLSFNNNSSNTNTAYNASYEDMLQHQLDWCSHLGIYWVILPSPYPNPTKTTEEKTNDDNDESQLEIAINYASAIIAAFGKHEEMVGIIPMPLTDDGWKLWTSLSILLRGTKNVRPAVIIGKDLPDKQLVEQWYAEGVQIFMLDEDVFLTNKKGFPVLSRPHQKVFTRFFRWIDCTIILTGEPAKSKQYSQYLRHLRSTVPELNDNECEEKPFWDVLQTPLQPLSHNLEYATYETFESDPVKYNGYEKAMIQALIDLDKKSVIDSTSKGSKQPFVVMVLGAGRGPLVSCAMRATKQTGIEIKLYAVEKNPHAVIILKNKNKTEWNNKVTIVQKDMRIWKYPEKAHIIVSELLGSFGDNELSPECLDGGQRVLRKDGISIPHSYTSYLCPITNNSVYSRLSNKPTDFETPYVIHLMRHCRLSKEIKKCWDFVHPNFKDKLMDNNSHNARYCKLTFKIDLATNGGAIIHGFAGYFDTVLYKDINLSIHPETFSKEMFSWFPYYFPLHEPIKVKNGDNVTIHLWRKTEKKCVWYEWCLTQPVLTQIHNPCHRSYSVDLQ